MRISGFSGQGRVQFGNQDWPSLKKRLARIENHKQELMRNSGWREESAQKEAERLDREAHTPEAINARINRLTRECGWSLESAQQWVKEGKDQ